MLLYHVVVETARDKKTRLLRAAGIALITAAGLIMILQGFRMMQGGVSHVLAALSIVGTVCIPLLAGTVLLTLSRNTIAERRHTVRGVVWALFAFYLLALFAALFFARIDFEEYAAHRSYYFDNLPLMTNFVPLATIRLYIRCLMYHYIGPGIPLSNLIGNVILFMPMAFFLPCLFSSLQKFWRFLLLMIAMLAAVEALQLALSCGSCDVDDVILNLAGTLLIYGLIRLPPVRRLMERVYLMSPAPGEKTPQVTVLKAEAGGGQ